MSVLYNSYYMNGVTISKTARETQKIAKWYYGAVDLLSPELATNTNIKKTHDIYMFAWWCVKEVCVLTIKESVALATTKEAHFRNHTETEMEMTQQSREYIWEKNWKKTYAKWWRTPLNEAWRRRSVLSVGLTVWRWRRSTNVKNIVGR